jgi:ankyrin repeat protein
MVRLLLEQGADPRAQDTAGRTPLMSTEGAAHARLLLTAVPDLLDTKDFNGRSAIAPLSYRSRHVEALEELLRVADEFDFEAHVNHKDVFRETALHQAMAGSNALAVKLLLERSAEELHMGSEDSTVLMKPFLHLDDDVDGFHSPCIAVDAGTSACLKSVLDAVACGGSEHLHSESLRVRRIWS